MMRSFLLSRGSEPEITHQGLCTTDGCPFPDDEGEWHTPWCQAIKGHRCFGGATHQHWPKKGMGGHNPESKIVACLCAGMHDAVDNGVKYGNAVIMDGEGRKVYRLWEVTIEPPGKTLIERVIGEGDAKKSGLTANGAKSLPSQSSVPLSDHPPAQEPDKVAGDLVLSLSKDEMVNALPAIQEATISYQERALVIEGALSWERYEELCAKLETTHKAIGFWIGDLIVKGEELFGERAYQPWTDKGYMVERLRQYAWVSSRIGVYVRKAELSFSIHREVAALPEPQQAEWLQRAQDEGLTTRQLHDCVTVHREPSG